MDMKTRYLIFFVITALVFSGCGEREGVVSSKQKIDRVMASETQYYDDEQVFSRNDYVEEQWTWDKKKVIRIDYRGESQYSENFFYDGRKIISTTVPAYDLKSEFEYDGRKLNKISFYIKESLSATMSFVRGEDNISAIVFHRYGVGSEKSLPAVASVPLVALVGTDVANIIGQDAARQMQSDFPAAKSDQEVRYSLTWKNDNVERIDVSGLGSPYTITLTYDDKNNPYDQLFAYHDIEDPIFGFKMLSKHNVTFIRMPFENKGTVDFKYAYTYDDDYPSSRKLTYNYVTLRGINDTVTVRVEKTEKYIYK